jgi:hypothetical protein
MQKNAAHEEQTALARPDISQDVWPEADTGDIAVFPEETETTVWAGSAFRTDSAGAIGHEVGEALFLDETEDYLASVKRTHSESPLELFADENDPALKSILAAPQPYSGPPPAAVVSAAAAAGKPRAVRVNLIAIALLILAVGTVTTLRACQNGRVPPAAVSEPTAQ